MKLVMYGSFNCHYSFLASRRVDGPRRTPRRRTGVAYGRE